MGGIKTHRTDDSAVAMIRDIADEGRRADCEVLLDLMQRVTGAEAEVWSSGLIGFGTYHYTYASGQEGDWFPVGFANRKAAITIYLGTDIEDSAELLSRLGSYKPGKGCIYLKRLADIDLAVLEQLVADSYAGMMRRYGTAEGT